MTIALSPELIAKLKEAAERGCWADKLDGDDEVVEDFAGGNVDDAYDGGYRSGETEMARWLLNELGVEFKQRS